MLLFILGFFDFVSSILLFLSLIKLPIILSISFTVGVILVLKGLYTLSMKSFFAAGTDLLAAAFLILASKGIYIHYVIVVVIGVLLFIKSMQSMVPELLG